MRKRPSVTPYVRPYRIAILVPKVTIEGPDAAYEREAALLLWATCLEVCQRHSLLAVLAPSTPLVRRDGHWVPDDDSGRADLECFPPAPSAASRFFGAARRDDVIRLEVSLGAKPAAVRLHSATRHDKQRSFEAAGRQFGGQFRDVIVAWLTACGVPNTGSVFRHGLPVAGGATTDAFEAVTADDLLAAVRALVPQLVDDRATPQPAIDQLVSIFQAPAQRVVDLTHSLDGSAAHGSGAAFSDRTPHSLVTRSSGRETTGFSGPRGAGRPATDRGGIETVGPESTRFSVEEVADAGMAMVRSPDALDQLEVAADALVRAERIDEALRLVERGVQLHGENPRAHLALLRALESSDRLGARLAQAMVSLRYHGCPLAPDLPSSHDQVEIDLRASSALVSVGRLDEAIALRASRLRDREASWPGQARLLERWRSEPRFLAQSYARDAYYRGDIARVLEGFSRTPPADSVDLAMLLETLVATGREQEAALAWGQFGLGYGCRAPIARLAAVNALVAAGRYRLGLEELWRVELAAPGESDPTAISRCGVVLAGVPLEVIEAAIGERIASGALTLARRMARIVADYVPAAATSAVIERALAKRTAIEFDTTWLCGFAACGDRPSTSHTDQLFVELGPMRSGSAAETEVVAELVRGDRLVTMWWPAVVRDAASSEPQALARAAAYMVAQALARYLAATTFPTTPIAGALRTVASEALAMVHAHRTLLPDADARAVFVALEPLLRRVDRWVGAGWLAATERSLGLDERAGGDISGFVGDLPTVAARILGPEETALLSWSVASLSRERRDGWAAKVSAQASRLAMHTGNAGLDEWAEATAAQLAAREVDLDDAVDSLQTACYLAEGVTAGPCVHAARVLFAAGRAQAAFDVLTGGFATARERGELWRAQQLDALRDAWSRGNLDVAFDLDGGSAGMFDALRNRDTVHSERLGRWAVAFDANDSEAHHNLGLALAERRNIVAAMHHLVRGTRERAPEILAVALNTAGFLDDAKVVLSYASRWNTLSWANRTAGAAREHPLASEPSAERDASLRGAETAPSASAEPRTTIPIDIEDVLSSTAEPRTTTPLDVEDVLSSTAGPRTTIPLEVRSSAAESRTTAPLDVEEAGGAPTALLELGDYTAAAAKLGDANWPVRAAALHALRFRTTAENHIDVTRRAQRGADVILAETIGATDPCARVARALALKIREQAHFARDPVPVLGTPMPSAEFDRAFRMRSGESVPDLPAERELVDRVVLSNSNIARISDYAALLRDLVQLTPDEALAQFDLDASRYLEVARAWAAAMESDPTIQAMVEARLARR